MRALFIVILMALCGVAPVCAKKLSKAEKAAAAAVALGLPLRETLQHRFVLLEKSLLHSLEVIFTFLLGGKSFDILICFYQRFSYKLGIR